MKKYDVFIIEETFCQITENNSFKIYCAFREIEEDFLIQLLSALKGLIHKINKDFGKHYAILVD